MTIVCDACTINIINDTPRSENDVSRSIIDDSRVTLQIVVSLFHDDRNMFIQGILKVEVSLYHWPPVWLVWISLFCKENCQLSYNWFQTSQTGGQRYSDTYPFSIPCPALAFPFFFFVSFFIILSNNITLNGVMSMGVGLNRFYPKNFDSENYVEKNNVKYH